ncbi:NAD(P)-binding domain-containing protein [Streptomyces sp. SID8352]|uniref:imine reductase family protein n=1 Tax=Streptomyces sp. SID8352 TaxID=2690338 RepID=UPI00136DD3B4|nr:NAD(P)-binding domain-containing protein [Streptomyces sp. SID8352]
MSAKGFKPATAGVKGDPQGVAVLGLGNMGTALADNLLRAGHATVIWNRTPGKEGDLVNRGAVSAETVEQAVRSAHLVVVSVTDYKVSHAILSRVTDSLAGRIILNVSSSSPQQASEAAAWAREHNVTLLHGAIMSFPQGVGQRDRMFLYSGQYSAYESVGPLLSCLGDSLYLGSAPGLASLYDTALLEMMYATVAAWCHGVALTSVNGIRPTDFTPVAVRWMSAVLELLTAYTSQADSREYPGSDASLDIHISAVDHLLEATHASDLDDRLPRLLLALLTDAAKDGHGSDGMGRLLEVATRRVAAA